MMMKEKPRTKTKDSLTLLVVRTLVLLSLCFIFVSHVVKSDQTQANNQKSEWRRKTINVVTPPEEIISRAPFVGKEAEGNWKTYFNPFYCYFIQYPKSWYLSPETPNLLS
jgi:hypothetical protein